MISVYVSFQSVKFDTLIGYSLVAPNCPLLLNMI